MSVDDDIKLATDGQGRTEPGYAEAVQIDPDKAGANRNMPDLTAVEERGSVISIPEVQQLFETAGVPRNQRSLRRYCGNRAMDCFPVDTQTGQRWMVSLQSAENYITQIKQSLANTKRASGGNVEYDQGNSKLQLKDRRGEARVENNEEVEELKTQIRQLEDEKDGLRINDLANKRVIAEFKSQFREVRNEISEQGRYVGALEIRLERYEAIEAPQKYEHRFAGASLEQNGEHKGNNV